jgi:uncharacterized protein YhbP (UPF0306 family)
MANRERQLARIAALLAEQNTLALATADERGEPCAAPLFYIADEDLSLYWLSSASSVHSANLARSAKASGTVFRQVADWKKICGVQMRGRAEAIREPKRRAALVERYCDSFQLGKILRLAIFQSTLYVFRPQFIRYIDNSKRLGYRFEIEIDDKKTANASNFSI